jgi:hypothetical protein
LYRSLCLGISNGGQPWASVTRALAISEGVDGAGCIVKAAMQSMLWRFSGYHFVHASFQSDGDECLTQKGRKLVRGFLSIVDLS